MKQDWHDYAGKLEAAERKLELSSICARNKQLIRDFKRQLLLDGISKARILVYASKLPIIAEIVGKDFDQCAKEDLMGFVECVESKPYSEWTKQSYKVVLKRFYRWLKNTGREYPEEVKWIRTNIRQDRLKLPGEGDLTTQEEVERLTNSADHPRDKALVAAIYESGCRIGEIGTLLIKDVSFGKLGAHLNVIGKTGSRQVFLVNSAHYLALWLSIHPDRNNRYAPLWVNIGNTNRGKQMNYPGIRKLLYNLFRKAGVNKKSKPHNFRHARATHLATGLNEFQMCQHFGWKLGSKMPGTYIHMSGKNTDDALLRMHGIVAPAQNDSVSKATPCPRCEHVNPASFQFCGKCGCALDVKAAMEAEERTKAVTEKRSTSDAVLNELLRDEEVRELLKRKLVAMR